MSKGATYPVLETVAAGMCVLDRMRSKVRGGPDEKHGQSGNEWKGIWSAGSQGQWQIWKYHIGPPGGGTRESGSQYISSPASICFLFTTSHIQEVLAWCATCLCVGSAYGKPAAEALPMLYWSGSCLSGLVLLRTHQMRHSTEDRTENRTEWRRGWSRSQ